MKTWLLALAILPGVALAQCPAGYDPINQMSVRNASDVIVQNACANRSDGTVLFLAPRLGNSNGSTNSQVSNPSPTDNFVYVEPTSCWMFAGTTAFTAGPLPVRAAANNLVLSATTNTTAGTITVDCDISSAMSRTTSGKGQTVTKVALLYGVQTTALASIAALSPASTTYPAAGGAASGTVATIGGSLTVTPASLQLTTTTTGQCFNEEVAFGTPFAYNSNLAMLGLEQVFTTAGTTATTLQICGAIVYFTNTPL